MALKWIFALFVYSSFLALSTSFLIDTILIGLFQSEHSFKCVNQYCDIQNDRRRDQSEDNKWCQIKNHDGVLEGQCINQHNHKCDHDHVLANNGEYCVCQDASCVNMVIARHQQHVQTQTITTLHCLGQTCDSGDTGGGRKRRNLQSCEIKRHNGVLEGHCIDHTTNNECHPNGVLAGSGDHCICQNDSCVAMVKKSYPHNGHTDTHTTLHCLGQTCDSGVCLILTVGNHQLYSSCHGIRFHLPCSDYRKPDSYGCYCTSADCVNTAVSSFTTSSPTTVRTTSPTIVTTTTPSPATVTTATMTLRPDQQTVSFKCEQETCDKYRPYCQLLESGGLVVGRCLTIQGTLLTCQSGKDVAKSGCVCHDDGCVTKTVNEYYAGQVLHCGDKVCSTEPYCHILEVNGIAHSRCFVVQSGSPCNSFTDVYGHGCYCRHSVCSNRTLLEFNLHTSTTSTTQQSTTTSNPQQTTTQPTTTPSQQTTTIQPTTTTPQLTTTQPTTTTPQPTTTQSTTTTPQPTTTQPTTTPSQPTTTQPTSTTPQPKTTQPTTTTPQPTTTQPTTMQPATQRSCNLCGNTDIQIPCSSREVAHNKTTMCSGGKNYCMTDVYRNAQGNIDIYKRCVDEATCQKEWVQESADQDYCKNYGVVNHYAAFSCHFCCVGDGCNTNIMPDQSLLYRKIY